MGQKKTWALHHVPYSMLWEPVSHDYTFNWNTIMQHQVITHYTYTIADFLFPKNMNYIIWQSKYVINKLYNINLLKKQPSLLKKKKITFYFNKNANNGTNETTTNKSYLVKTANYQIIIHLFFKPSFTEQKKQIQYKKNQKEQDNILKFKNFSALKKAQQKIETRWPQNRLIFLKNLKASLLQNPQKIFSPIKKKLAMQNFKKIKKKFDYQNQQIAKMQNLTESNKINPFYHKL